MNVILSVWHGRSHYQLCEAWEEQTGRGENINWTHNTGKVSDWLVDDARKKGRRRRKVRTSDKVVEPLLRAVVSNARANADNRKLKTRTREIKGSEEWRPAPQHPSLRDKTTCLRRRLSVKPARRAQNPASRHRQTIPGISYNLPASAKWSLLQKVHLV